MDSEEYFQAGACNGLWMGGWTHGPLQSSPETAELPGQRKEGCDVHFVPLSYLFFPVLPTLHV